MSTRSSHHRLIILGSGPAGLTAAIYAARATLNPLVIEGPQPCGQLMGTSIVENWPGAVSIQGPQLMLTMREQAVHCGALFSDARIERTDLSQRPFMLIAASHEQFTCDALIIATGATPRRLGCPGEDTYWGKGVSTCAVCDGAFYRSKTLVVVGGGDTAMEDASFLAKLGNTVIVVHIRGSLGASAAMQKRALSNPAISFIYNSTVSGVQGDGKRIASVSVTHNDTGAITTLAADGVFVAIGLIPNSGIFQGQLELARSGHILVANHTMTKISGVFAAGDIVDGRYRQAVTSAGDGCRAALDAERFLTHGTL